MHPQFSVDPHAIKNWSRSTKRNPYLTYSNPSHGCNNLNPVVRLCDILCSNVLHSKQQSTINKTIQNTGNVNSKYYNYSKLRTILNINAVVCRKGAWGQGDKKMFDVQKKGRPSQIWGPHLVSARATLPPVPLCTLLY